MKGVKDGGAKLAESLDERDAGTDERRKRAGNALRLYENDYDRTNRRQDERYGHGCLRAWGWGLLWPGAAIAPWTATRTRIRFPVLRENLHVNAPEWGFPVRMGGDQVGDDARAYFAERLTELMDRSGLTPRQISTRVRPATGEKWTINDKRLSSWRNGANVPNEKPFRALTRVLIRHAIERKVVADITTLGLLDEAAWERWWKKARRQPASLTPAPGKRAGVVLEEPTAPPVAFAFEQGPLPRLRQLTDMAWQEAGRVGSWSYFSTGSEGEFAEGLYVHRDLETTLLEALAAEPGSPLLVRGDPGFGKTSLLWGLAARLLAEGTGEVFLVKSVWLLGEAPLVDGAMLADAVERATMRGRRCTLLIDTADVLAGNERAQLTLREVVRAATMRGGAVVVTSRPAEANALPTSWRGFLLGPYATAATPDGSPNEFERAVAAHARFYCRTQQQAAKLADQLLGAVSRRQPIGPLCGRPLTLRLLSELYSPGTVPQTIDVTGLYELFWLDRVCQDRRVGARTGDSPEFARDLSACAAELALRMLRSGIPQVALDTDILSRWRDEIDLLCRRGVGGVGSGEVRPGAEFQFFHQTFFEFAAARGLLARYGGQALKKLRGRVLAQPADYVRLAVFEQIWLCAWRTDDNYPAATELAADLLDAVAQNPEAVPYSVRRIVLAVLFQIAEVPSELHPQLLSLVATADPAMLRDALALTPAPGRRLSADDLALLACCVKRDDATWVTVIEVLDRLVGRDPGLALDTIWRIGLLDKVVALPMADIATRYELPLLLARLAVTSQEQALEILSRLCQVAVRKRNPRYLAAAFNAVRSAGLDRPQQVAAWADATIGGGMGNEQALIVAHALLHRDRALAAAASGWDPLLAELREVTAQSDGELTARDAAVFGGLLQAFADAAPSRYVGALAELIESIVSRRLFGELQRGWLAALIASPGCSLRPYAIEWLIKGLPASHSSPASPSQRLADTVRRAIERPDVPVATSAEIADTVVRQLRCPDPWLDRDVMLRLLVRAAVAHVPDAFETLRLLEDPSFPLSKEAARTLSQKLREPVTDLREAEVIFTLTLRRGDLKTLERLTIPAEFVVQNGKELTDLITRALASKDAERQRLAAELHQRLTRTARLPSPAWDDLVAALRRAIEPRTREILADLALYGAVQDVYPYTGVREALSGLLRSDETGALARDNDVIAARRALVSLHAVLGPIGIGPELLDVAFRKPIDGPTLAKASSFLRTSHRIAADPPSEARADYLIDMGRRLVRAGVSSSICKDNAARWRHALAETIERATLAERRRILDAIPGLDPQFATVLVLKFDVLAAPGIRADLERLIDTPGIDGRVRRGVRIALQGSPPVGDRWDFDAE